MKTTKKFNHNAENQFEAIGLSKSFLDDNQEKIIKMVCSPTKSETAEKAILAATSPEELYMYALVIVGYAQYQRNVKSLSKKGLNKRVNGN